MIKNIVFDMGKVLIYWDPHRLVERLGYTGEDAALLEREVFTSAEWTALDRGLSVEEVLPAILARLPEHLHPAAEHFCRAWWEEELWPVRDMAPLVRELKAAGYGIYLLSNATSCLHRYFDRIPGSECFDGKIVSADHRILKPEKEIYQLLFATYGLDPEECWFIDDWPGNMEAANRLGMRGSVFYDDVPRLRRELKAAGVRIG